MGESPRNFLTLTAPKTGTVHRLGKWSLQNGEHHWAERAVSLHGDHLPRIQVSSSIKPWFERLDEPKVSSVNAMMRVVISSLATCGAWKLRSEKKSRGVNIMNTITLQEVHLVVSRDFFMSIPRFYNVLYLQLEHATIYENHQLIDFRWSEPR